MQKFEVVRQCGAYVHSEVIDAYNKFGVVILKNFFESKQIQNLRFLVEQGLEEARGKGGVLKFENFSCAGFFVWRHFVRGGFRRI